LSQTVRTQDMPQVAQSKSEGEQLTLQFLQDLMLLRHAW
jgi:hypothetical protein